MVIIKNVAFIGPQLNLTSIALYYGHIYVLIFKLFFLNIRSLRTKVKEDLG